MVVLTSSPWTAEALSTLAAVITTLRQAGSPAT
jgi:hypothetical protein